MKSLLKWLVKKFIGKAELKNAIFAGTAALAKREVSESTAKVLEVSNDVSDILGAFLEGYAGDGRISEAELANINAVCSRILDKYITDEAVSAFLDKVLG